MKMVYILNLMKKICLKYEVSQLSNKYPDYKILLNEYKEGILLFNISNDKIWSKANKDTIGLNLFYKENSLQKIKN